MMTDAVESSGGSRVSGYLFRAATWLLALGCFYLVYTRIEAAAARDGLTAVGYLVEFFRGADWTLWLAVMIPYSVFFFLVDAHATWRVVRWFNAPDLRLRNILPIRASAYVLSLVNEQVGKGAMSLYLLRALSGAGVAGAVEHDLPGAPRDLSVAPVLRIRGDAELPPRGGGLDAAASRHDPAGDLHRGLALSAAAYRLFPGQAAARVRRARQAASGGVP